MALENGDLIFGGNSAPYSGFTTGAARMTNSLPSSVQTNTTACALNAAGTLAAFGHSAGTYLEVFNADDWSAVTIADMPAGSVNGLAFSPDGTMLAVAHSTTPFVTVYSTSTWAKLSSPATLPTGTAYGVAFSPDSAKLAVAHATAPRLTVYATADWSKIADPATPPTATGQAVAFSPDGTKIAVGLSAAPWARVYNAADLSNAGDPSLSSNGGVNTVEYSPDGSKLAFGTEAGSKVYIFSSAGYAAVAGPTIAGAVNSISWATSTEIVVASDGYPRLTIYDTATGASTIRTMAPFNCLAVAARKYTPKAISGTVRDSNSNGISRLVRAYRRDTGELVGQIASNGVTGAYSITTRHAGEHDVVMLDDVAGSIENDQILRTTTL